MYYTYSVYPCIYMYMYKVELSENIHNYVNTVNVNYAG